MDYDGNRFASCIWCYIIFPLIGAIVAAVSFRVHIKLENMALKQDASEAAVAEWYRHSGYIWIFLNLALIFQFYLEVLIF